MPRTLSLAGLAAGALPRLVFVGALLLLAPVASRAIESRVGYVRWHEGPGEGLVHVGASRPLEVLLHLRDLGSLPGSVPAGDVRVACAAGDVDGDGHGDLWVLSSLTVDEPVGGGTAVLVSGRTRQSLRRFRQYELRAENLSVEVAGDVDGDGVDDLLLGQAYPGGSKVYWIRGGASGRLLLDVQRMRTNMLAPVVVDRLADGRPGLAVGATPRDAGVPWEVVLVDAATGSAVAPAVMQLDPPRVAAVSLGDLDGDGKPELGGGLASDLLADRLELVWSTGRATTLARAPEDGLPLRVSTAGDVDGDGVPDLLVEAPFAEGPSGTWCGELWVVSGASLVQPRGAEVDSRR